MSSKSISGIPPIVFLGLAAAVIATALWGISALSKAEKAEEGAPPASGPRPATVIVAPVQKIAAAQSQRVTGSLHARSRAEIAAREAGPIDAILVNEGDSIKKDSVIARIDPSRLNAQIAEATSEITVAEALVHQRQSRVNRSTIDLRMKEELYEAKAISEAEVLDARSANNVDQSVADAAADSLAAAKSRLDLLKVRLKDLEILAPFSGRIVSRHIEPGEWVEPGNPVVTLVSSGEIEAWLQVPERFAGTARGTEVPVTISATGRTLTSTSLTVVPEAGTDTRTIQVIATLPNPDGKLIPGLSVTAEVPVSEDTERLAVPINAVVQGYAGPGIFVPDPQETGLPMAKRIPVKILFRKDSLVFIEAEGLKDGDQVVVEGNERLFPSQPLLVGSRDE